MIINQGPCGLSRSFRLCILLSLSLAACQSVSPLPSPGPQPTQTSTTSPISSPTSALAPSPTSAPSSDRTQPISYEVQPGDTLTSIAQSFQLSPQTILWANYALLFDFPDFLTPAMQLQILPTDGIYHQIGGTDTLLSLAAFFDAQMDVIIAWPANQIDPQNPLIFAGDWIMIPGARRQSRWRQMPDIPSQAAALNAEEFGSGACTSNFENPPPAAAEYNWPLAHFAHRGEVFSSWHPGMDMAVNSGEIVVAADAGVVVFSGWSNLGYGNLMMLDHGNGDFSLYSGLRSLLAPCGQFVLKGAPIAEAANTAYAAGPILHFEIRSGGQPLDPAAIISAP